MQTFQAVYNILQQFCVLKACFILILTGIFCCIIGIFYRKTSRRLQKNDQPLGAALLKALYKPLLIFVTVLGFTYALEVLCLAWQSKSINALHLIRHLFFIGLFAWFLWDFVSFYSHILLNRYKEDKKIDRTLIHAINQIAKIAIIIITALSLFQLFGLSIAGLLAFGGMGGIIIGFAAKDLLASIFGNIMLFLDRPFVMGEQISLPALKVEGQVQTMGWRACEILTPDCRLVYVPNALFANLVVENRSRIYYRRFSCSLCLRYQDLDKIPEILAEIKALLEKAPAIDKTRSIVVHLHELSHSSLNILVDAYTTIVDSADFLVMQQALYLELLGCIYRHGAKWAFQDKAKV
jgi:MscS family membrane protein